MEIVAAVGEDVVDMADVDTADADVADMDGEDVHLFFHYFSYLVDGVKK